MTAKLNSLKDWQVRLYRLGEVPDPNPFMKVYNEGTKVFSDFKLGGDLDALDFLSLAKYVKRNKEKTDKTRSNLQVNLGWSGGENQRREDDEIKNHFGCAMNALNRDSRTFCSLFIQLSNLARKLGIPWADPMNVDCELFQQRVQKYAQTLHPKNCFEGVTIALLELHPNPGKVSEHVDDLNDPKYTETMICNAIVKLDDKLYRVSVIAYMRKACGDSIVRREACRETAESILAYVGALSQDRLPALTPKDAIPYYKKLGSMGLVITYSQTGGSDFSVHDAALLSQPHLDKPFGFLSPAAGMLRQLHKNHLCLSRHDLVSMALPLAHLNGTFSYLCALSSLIKSPSLLVPGDGLGYMEPVVAEIKKAAGSYSAGRMARATHWRGSATGIDVETTREVLKFICKECDKSSEDPPHKTTYEAYCQDRLHILSTELVKKIAGSGLFGVIHLIHVLCLTGLLSPVGMLHCSRFATTTKTLAADRSKEQDDRPNPCMIRYLNSGSSGSTRGERAKRVLFGVSKHLATVHSGIKITTGIVEQTNCESNRKKKVVDIFPLGCCNNHLLSTLEGSARTVQEVVPCFDATTQTFSVCSSCPGMLEARNSSFRFNDSGTGMIPTPKMDGKHSRLFARIPLAALQCFDGLLTEVRQLFFRSSPEQELDIASALQRIEGNHVLKKLAHHYVKSNNSVAYTVDLGISTLNARPIGFELICPSRFNTEKFNEMTGHLVPPAPTANVTKPTSASTTRTVCNTIRKKEPVPLRKKEPFPLHCGATTPTFPIKIREKEPVPLHSSVSNTFHVYRFPNVDMRSVAFAEPKPPMNTLRKIIQACPTHATLELSSLYTELQAAMFFGMCSSKVPLTLSSANLLVSEIERDELDLLESNRHPGKLYKANWTGDAICVGFFTCDLCKLVDRVAKLLGGIKVSLHCRPSGCVDWIFSSPEQAETHLLFSLLFLSGKPRYFQRLLSRIAKQHRRQFDSPYAMPLTVNGKTILYAVLLEPGCLQNYKKGWALCLPGSDGIDFQLLDVWSWKSGEKMVTHPLPLPLNFDMHGRKRRKPRGGKKQWMRKKRAALSPLEDCLYFSEATDDDQFMDLDDL